MKIIFLGSSEFSIGVLNELVKSHHKVVALICQPDRPSGRGHNLVSPKIKEYAQSLGIKVLQFEKVNKNIEEIFSNDCDAFVTASFGQILSREFLSQKIGLNVHPSKLPQYRGPTPLQTALLNGDKETAVTIQKMAYEVDSGDIMGVEDVKIDDEDTFFSLTEKTSIVGGKLLVKVLDDLEKGTAKFEKQDDNYATYTKMISKEDGHISFNMSASAVVNKIRALGENPGCYFFVGDDRIKVKKASICDTLRGVSGQIFVENKRFFVSCLDKDVEILMCQAPNGKMMSAKDFINGYRFKENIAR